MKRLLWCIPAMLFSVASAQTPEAKFDEAAIIKNIEKLEADSHTPKRGAKGDTWIDLGDAYLDAATIATSQLYRGLDTMMGKIFYPKPEVGKETIGNVEYMKWSYPYFDAYLKDGVVYFWKVKRDIVKDGLDKAAAAYKKAYELDPKDTKTKVVKGLEKIANAYKQNADNLYALQDFAKTADVFAAAYEIQKAEPVNKADTVSSYYAGLLYTSGGQYDKAVKYLTEALDNGCESNGDIYYYLFHGYYGQKDYEKAKEILEKGMAKYPKNSELMEQQIVLSAVTNEDPATLIPRILENIKNDPNNPKLWGGLGKAYDQMGNTEEALKAFDKERSLSPNDFNSNYNYALMLLRVADKQTEEFNKKTFTGQSDRDAALKELAKYYEATLDPLEKAYTANPNDINTIELLKNVYFRLRDNSPEMMKNFEKFDAIFKSKQ